jgi:hypothetical protein
MKDIELLQMALGIAPPRQVTTAEFNPNKKRLEIHLDFPKGSTFTCSDCGQVRLKVYGTIEMKLPAASGRGIKK